MTVQIIDGDCLALLAALPPRSVHCCVTSPPYWGLRDYGVAGQIGLEPTVDAYVQKLVAVFEQVRRCLRDDGTLWLNLGDSYAARDRGDNATPRSNSIGRPALQENHWAADINTPTMKTASLKAAGVKPKDLIGVPWRMAFALQARGWYLRQDIIWAKPNPMPESVTDRCTKAHEYVFLLTKSDRYYFDAPAIAEPFADQRQGNPGRYARTASAAKGANNDRQDGGFLNDGAGWNADGAATSRNKRDVWTISSRPFNEAHFATFPPELPELCIKAGCPGGGMVLDPFNGAGTTGLVADRLGRNYIGIELNPAYAAMARRRIAGDAPLFTEVAGAHGEASP